MAEFELTPDKIGMNNYSDYDSEFCDGHYFPRDCERRVNDRKEIAERNSVSVKECNCVNCKNSIHLVHTQILCRRWGEMVGENAYCSLFEVRDER